MLQYLVGTTSRTPKWIKPQLTRLVDEAPTGDGWLHEIKYDGYRMHARIEGDDIKLRTLGQAWTGRIAIGVQLSATVDAVASQPPSRRHCKQSSLSAQRS